MSENQKEFTVYNYLQGINNKKILGSKCKGCGAQFVPPRKICTECNSTELEWAEMSGNGKVAAFSAIGVGTKFFVDKGYSMKNPYCFSVIELEEGPMISGQLVGVDEKNADTINIGMTVKAKFLETEIEGEKPRIDLGFEPA